MKNKYVDGLRGFAAINVILAHFISAFVPTMFHKNLPDIFIENQYPSALFEALTSPFISILYNGHFAVLIFFVLSGHVLTLPYYSKDCNIKTILLKRLCGRYLRLNLPIAAAILISYLIYKLGLYSNTQAAELIGPGNWFKNFYPEGITVTTALKEVVYKSIFFGQSTLIPALWTMKIEFIGSLYVLVFYIIKPNKNSTIPLLIFLGLIYVLHQQSSVYYFSIFFGSQISRLRNFANKKILIFAIGFYFGAFQFKSLGYDFLPSLSFSGFDIWEKKSFYNAVGAAFMTLAVMQGYGHRLFTSRLAQSLGKISFSIYLLHTIVLCTLTSFVYIQLPNHKFFLLVNLIIYFLTCVAVSIIFEKIVDSKSIYFSKKISAHMLALFKLN